MLYRKLIDSRRRTLGARHERLVQPYDCLARILIKQGHRAEAIRLLREAENIAIEFHGPDAPDTLDAEIELAEGLFKTMDAEGGAILCEGLLARVDGSSEAGRAQGARAVRCCASGLRAAGQEERATALERTYPFESGAVWITGPPDYPQNERRDSGLQ